MKLIDSLTPRERLWLFAILGGNGLVWGFIGWGLAAMFGYDFGLVDFVVIWAAVTLVGLKVLERFHNLKQDEDNRG